jgi:hypothetical protein
MTMSVVVAFAMIVTSTKKQRKGVRGMSEIEKAIDYLQKSISPLKDLPSTEMNRVLDTAITALKKQVPKGQKSLGERDEWYAEVYTCTICGAQFPAKRNFCWNCGQALKDAIDNGAVLETVVRDC